MPNHNMKHPKLPEWFRDLKPWSWLTSRDVVSIFGYTDRNVLHHCVFDKYFPQPDTKISGHSMWKVSTIKAEIKRREKLCNGEEQK